MVSQQESQLGLAGFLERSGDFQLTTILPDEFLPSTGKEPPDPGSYDLFLFEYLNEQDLFFLENTVKEGIPAFLISTEKIETTTIGKLAKISGEAGTPVGCYNPFWYNPFFIDIHAHIEDPFLSHFYFMLKKGTPEEVYFSLYYQIELSLMITKGNFLKSTVNTYSYSNRFPDIFLVQLEYDSGAKTELLLQKNSVEENLFVFRSKNNITYWYPDKNKILESTRKSGNTWSKKIRRSKRNWSGEAHKLFINAVKDLADGNPVHPTIEERNRTARIFEGIKEKIAPRFT